MNSSEPLSEADRRAQEPKRYRIVVATVDKRQFTYYVCSCLDDRKALVIASEVHHKTNPAARDRIYEVIEVVGVWGRGPQSVDLCDRAEW